MKTNDRPSTMTIPVTPMLSRLRIAPKERDVQRVQRTMLRWMQRAAHRVGRFINEPSLTLECEYDIAQRRVFLYTCVDTVPDASPEFLRYSKIDSTVVNILTSEEAN